MQEALEQLEALVEQLALVAETSRHDAVRLGALKAQLAASAQRLTLLQAVGVLPRNLGLIRNDVDNRRMAEQIADVFERHCVSDEAAREVIEALESERSWLVGGVRRNGNCGR